MRAKSNRLLRSSFAKWRLRLLLARLRPQLQPWQHLAAVAEPARRAYAFRSGARGQERARLAHGNHLAKGLNACGYSAHNAGGSTTPEVPDEIALFDALSATGCAFGPLCRKPTDGEAVLNECCICHSKRVHRSCCIACPVISKVVSEVTGNSSRTVRRCEASPRPTRWSARCRCRSTTRR